MSKRPIKKTRSTNNSWAIETTLPEHPYLESIKGQGFPAFYLNRRGARASLANAKAGYVLPQKARAVRVAVTVTTIGRG